MPNTKVVGIIFPYILTPIPNLYDHSFPRYGQITFLTFRRPTTLTFDLWPKILKIFVSHGVPIRNMYAKFHNDRLRNGWDMKFCENTDKQTNKHTHKQTNTQTDMGITIPRPPPMGGEVMIRIWNWRTNIACAVVLLAHGVMTSHDRHIEHITGCTDISW